MWKYRCKSHLFALFVAFVLGCILTAISFSNGLSVYQEYLPKAAYNFIVHNKVLTCLCGGLGFSGIVNVVFIAQYAMSIYNVSPFIFLFLMFFASEFLLYAGIILVIPSVIVCIYGIVSLRLNIGKQMSAQHISQDSEIVRMYQIHHTLREETKELADTCRTNVNKATGVYILGLIALGCLAFALNNVFLFMIAIIVFMFLFNMLLRYRSSCMIPITSLLYEQCDPEACASALIYYSTIRNRVRLKNQSLLAQCLIYMDDPELAQDVLINYPRKDAASSLTYYSLMAYIYYLLKDEEGLQRCLEEAKRIRLGFGQTGVMIQNEEVLAIQNKIDLMNSDFSKVKRYYLNALKKAHFKFQTVDASYYIAMISFVEQDYPLANHYFEKVIQMGNTMSFVEKAKKFQSKMSNMDLTIDDYTYES